MRQTTETRKSPGKQIAKDIKRLFPESTMVDIMIKSWMSLEMSKFNTKYSQ